MVEAGAQNQRKHQFPLFHFPHTGGGPGETAQMWRLLLSAKENALEVLWTLGWGGSSGTELGVEMYWVLSQRGVFKVSLPYPLKEVSAEAPKDICPRP